MVKLNEVKALNTGLVESQPLVAVFFGGTGGIGSYTLRELATTVGNWGKGLRAYIVGRNSKVAEDIMTECRAVCKQGQFMFVKAHDLSLIQDVDRVCADIIELEEKQNQDATIDYLMVSQGGSIFQPRKDTKEGIDVTMSLMYYSRMRAIIKLLPLLLKSTLPATVVSVYAAGFEAKIFAADLSLRDPKHYSYSQARSHMVYMHTLFMESLANKHREKLSLVHVFPGLVLGPTFHSSELPRWFRIVFNYMVIPLFGWLITVPAKESGERMVSLASARYPPRPLDDGKTYANAVIGTDGKAGSGAYALTWNGESNHKSKAYVKLNKDELREKVWNHTIDAFNTIEAGEVFNK